ncbi:MAG: ChbG/HpnK family deacetylase [Verrucomicrobia bacterium]|nr:ChbG/HpnK family deacetylase [Verrucomicrobiota bacterium]
MAAPETSPALVVNADDFGQSSAINAAVRQAHAEGILTTASLMVNGAACAEAVAIARDHPRLGVGLHLTLAGGAATLTPREIPGLVNAHRQFRQSPVRAGLAYFCRRSLEPQLESEIRAQFDRFQATGLTLDHVNGHLNLHLHPTVLRWLCAHAPSLGCPGIRLTRDPFWLNATLASGRWLYRATHALVFAALAAWARPILQRHHLRHTHSVFGLLQNAHVTEEYVLGLLPRLPAGASELYAHPSTHHARHELDALLSPRVRAQLAQHRIRLIRYQDL